MRPLEDIIAAVQSAETVALVSHIGPDGDTVGSALALALGFRRLGKQVALFCDDDIPQYLRFLPGADAYRRPEADERFDLLFCVDASDLERFGGCAALTQSCAVTAQIDHHVTNTRYARYNCVDEAAPATAILAYELLRRLGVTIDQPVATCIYAGIATDTNNFSFSSTTAEAFRIAGDLAEAGLPLGDVNRLLFHQMEAGQMRLMGRGLSGMTLHHGGAISCITLTWRDFLACGALLEHAVTVANYGLDVRGVRMSLTLRETDVPGELQLSMRALPPLRVDEIAKALGGGGHRYAAGATLHGTLEDCAARVIAMMERQL